jgi:hypothetical protein
VRWSRVGRRRVGRAFAGKLATEPIERGFLGELGSLLSNRQRDVGVAAPAPGGRRVLAWPRVRCAEAVAAAELDGLPSRRLVPTGSGGGQALSSAPAADGTRSDKPAGRVAAPAAQLAAAWWTAVSELERDSCGRPQVAVRRVAEKVLDRSPVLAALHETSRGGSPSTRPPYLPIRPPSFPSYARLRDGKVLGVDACPTPPSERGRGRRRGRFNVSMPRRPKTYKRQEALRLVSEGFSDSAAARAVNVSQTSVWRWRREAGFAAQSSNRRLDVPRRPRQPRRAPATTPGLIAAAARELFPAAREASKAQPAAPRPPRSAPLPSRRNVTPVAPPSQDRQLPQPQSLAPVLAAARAGLVELERGAPSRPRRARRAAPLFDGTTRVRVAGCSHVLYAAAGDRVGAAVPCGPCHGLPRVVEKVLAPWKHAAPWFG